ncbi:unnamed protein product [Cylicocyclus nassatus]|uniref:Uncharacterized protein n=1 Tax=Cylicocyclus nassatus TaxID=53992 RepID=A0AA36DVS9_CYLNA|nr:unnamed protein product [Cylicocyclus nassatus]
MTTLSRPHVIASLIWSLAATAATAYFMYKSPVCKESPPSQEVEEEDNDNDDDSEDLADGEDVHISKFEQILFVLGYCREQWILYLAGSIFMLVQITAAVLEPSTQGDVIETATKQKGYHALMESMMICFGIIIIKDVFDGLSCACLERATSLIGGKMKMDLFESIVNREISFFDANSTGKLISKLYDCDVASRMVSRDVITFAQSIVLTLSSLAFLLVYSWKLTVLTFITIPTMYVVNELYTNFANELDSSSYSMSAKIAEIANEIISFACDKREVKRFSDNLEKLLLLEGKSSLGRAGYSWTINIAYDLTYAALLVYGGHQILAGEMSPAMLTTFTLYVSQLKCNIDQIYYTALSVKKSISVTKKIMTYIKNASKQEEEGTLKPEVCGAIEMTSVNFTYPSRPSEEVLKDLSLRVEYGTTVAIVGASGAGKSTIVALLEQFYKPSSGTITLDGNPIEEIERDYYHEKIALVAQEPVLYDRSIKENIVYGCEWATEDDMRRVAAMVDAHDFIMQLEKGYKTKCGERGAQLSGGQKQRIALARALVRKPTILILDEATSALDSQSEQAILESLRRIAGTMTVIIIAHRLSTIKNADRIYVIDKGTVVQSGTHAELLEDVNGIYSALFASQTDSVSEACLASSSVLPEGKHMKKEKKHRTSL